MLKRVVVTGIGVLAPNGNDLKSFWENIVNGAASVSNITRFDASLYRTKFASEIKDYDPSPFLDKSILKKTDLFTQYALIASDEAITDAGFDVKKMNPFDVGVIWGSGQGGMDTFESQVTEFVSGTGAPRFSPFLIPRFIANMSSGMISIRNGYMGINYTTTSACATGNTSIMDAFNYIRLGKAKIIVTGASEAPITPTVFGGFSALKAMSTSNENPGTACRPFDIDRNGFVMSEGAGALVLEEYEHAVKRGAKIYGEIAGAAMTADAYHMTATHPEAKAAIRAMELAMEEARINISDINYLNPHATSTPVGDLSEAKAILTLAGSASNNILISATKSVTGHLLGASGAVEAVICLLAMTHNIVPPTINTSKIDPAISPNFNLVTGEARDAKILVTLSNAFGFGGHNATVIFKKI